MKRRTGRQSHNVQGRADTSLPGQDRTLHRDSEGELAAEHEQANDQPAGHKTGHGLAGQDMEFSHPTSPADAKIVSVCSQNQCSGFSQQKDEALRDQPIFVINDVFPPQDEVFPQPLVSQKT